jgi:hypothetical protein
VRLATDPVFRVLCSAYFHSSLWQAPKTELLGISVSLRSVRSSGNHPSPSSAFGLVCAKRCRRKEAIGDNPSFVVRCKGIPAEKQSRSRAKSRFQIFLGLIAFSMIYLPHSAYASSNGISGYSGKSGVTCTSCHSTGPAPTVTLSGPSSVASGSTNTYTLTVSGSGNSGMDVAASAGTFTAGTGSKILNGEVVHSSPSTSHSWTFSWTAPTVTNEYQCNPLRGSDR